MVALAALASSHVADAQTSHRSAQRARLGVLAGQDFLALDLQLRLNDRLVLGAGPLVGLDQVEFGARVALDTYVVGQPFHGGFIRSELATRVRLDVDRRRRDPGILGAILVGATWSLDGYGPSFGGAIGVRADYRVYGQVRRIQLDVAFRLSVAWAW